jgi:Domain of unknown function (DUF4333)
VTRDCCRQQKGNTMLAALALAVLTSVGVCACGSGSHLLKVAEIERAVQRTIATERGLRANVTCPARVPQRRGDVFTCTATLDVGSYPVSVTQTNASGRVRYDSQQPLIALNVAKVERAITTSIARQRGLAANVRCPPEVLQRAGIRFSCVAITAARDHPYPFVVTEVDDSGRVRYVGR